jgi:hypothetical protein
LSGAIWNVTKLASITFLSLALSYWIDYLGFITEGKLADVLITSSLGVLNWSVIYIINTAPSSSTVDGSRPDLPDLGLIRPDPAQFCGFFLCFILVLLDEFAGLLV